MKSFSQILSDGSDRVVNGCLEWTGYRTKTGYGQFRQKGKTYYAHRVAYEVFSGSSAQGKFVCHKCDNPACIDPDHLFLGTNADNMADCAAKGRTARQQGEKSGKAKLTDDQAKEVWQMVGAGRKQSTIASEFGVDATVVSRIARGKAWPHIHAEMSAVICAA